MPGNASSATFDVNGTTKTVAICVASSQSSCITTAGRRFAGSDPRGGRAPKLSTAQQELLMQVYRDGTHTSAELSEIFRVSRATVYRTIQRNAGGVDPGDDASVT
ncbi:hypothetical protein GCM10009819_08300 [Agromyces tropicus]|uniref:Resolvase HTH domain-containing protein n=1 Tax=Agromyces tropicus TaxID=555371 RepID=A0ABP5FL32_9MICO